MSLPHGFYRRRGVAQSIRRIAVAEIDEALMAIADPGKGEAEVVHAVRQQLKRLRALIRLARGHFDAYREENAAFRDLGRRLAENRDADVLIETYDELLARTKLVGPRSLRKRLVGQAGTSAARESRRPLLDGEITAGLMAARRRAEGWHFERKGFSLLAGGLKAVYVDMREDEALAAEHPTAISFHEWRKQAKHHANQLALLEPIAPEVVKSYRKIADKLAKTLGEHHDLDGLAAATLKLGSKPANAPILDAIESRTAYLETEAFRLGHELAAERPADFLRRLETGWRDWRK